MKSFHGEQEDPASLEVVKQYIEDQRKNKEPKHIKRSRNLTGRKRDMQMKWRPR